MGNGTYMSQAIVYAGPDDATRAQVFALLQRAGFHVVGVSEEDEILRCFDDHRVGLVLLNDAEDGSTSLKFCNLIRRVPEWQEVSILLLVDTVVYDEALLNAGFNAGVTDIMGLPLSPSVFLNRVDRLMQASAAITEIRDSEAKSDMLLNAIPDSMLILGKRGYIEQYMPGAEETHLRALQDDKRYVSDYLPEKTASEWLKLQEDVLKTGSPASGDFELVHPTKGRAYYQARFVPYVKDRVLVIASEVTERKKAEQRIRRLAFYDTLTGLPNRQLFLRHLDKLIEKSKKNHSTVGVIFVDLDNFKRINDNLGHTFGDGVLKEIAKRLKGCVRKENTQINGPEKSLGIARLGGDEFVCAMTDFGDEAVLNKIADRIRNTLRQPVEFRGHEFVVTPSMGVTVFPGDGDTAEDLLKNADLAMYQAKGSGRNTIRFYSGTMTLRSMRRLDLEGRLRRAIDNGDLELFYQPKYELASAKAIGMEALVRWRDEDGDFIPPAHFIPLAEDSGLITPLGEWVLREACGQIRRWNDEYGEQIQVGVNISGQQFYQSDLRNVVMQILFDSQVRPDLLQLELTESLLMEDVKDTISTLRALRDAGVSLAIDDFGTGYSSLSYLKKFPIDLLKIDRSFVAELEENNDDAAICAAIIAMAHQLGLAVVAEGIETQPQLDYLREQGCEYGQGYLLGKPMPADDAVALVRQVSTAKSVLESN